MKKTTLTRFLLSVTLVGVTALGQTTPTPTSTVDTQHEQMAGQLEEIAMCHHAIKAAHHDALSLGQSPYYRQISSAVSTVLRAQRILRLRWLLARSGVDTAICSKALARWMYGD
jgi:hypothetical protein